MRSIGSRLVKWTWTVWNKCNGDKFLNFQRDNGSYVPDLTQGLFQPLEVMEEDELLNNLDIEKLIEESELLTNT